LDTSPRDAGKAFWEPPDHHRRLHPAWIERLPRSPDSHRIDRAPLADWAEREVQDVDQERLSDVFRTKKTAPAEP
jgi:hypothetical protein